MITREGHLYYVLYFKLNIIFFAPEAFLRFLLPVLFLKVNLKPYFDRLVELIISEI